MAGQGSRIVLQVVSVTVLARLLTPGDYGLVAMVLVIVGVGEIFRDFGLSSSAVQATTLSRAERDNLLWLNTGIGVVLGGLVFGGADLIANLYDRPELADVARGLSLTFLLNGIATQYRADLLRRLRFGALAVVDVVSPVTGLAVATTLAATGWGYWALVAQSVTHSATILVGVMVAARWLPGRPSRAGSIKHHIAFGGRLVGTQLIGYTSNNVDTLLIGLRFGAGPLGLYNRAFQLVMTPLAQLRAPTTTVALPVLSRLQEDLERSSDFLRRGQLALGYTLIAGLALAVGAAEPLVDVLLGPRWTEVTPILRLLATAGAFQTLAYVGYWVYLSRGLTKALLRYTLMASTLKVLCVATGSLWGVVGVATGYAVAHLLEWPLSLWWLSRRTVLPVRDLVLGALRITAVAAAGALAAALAAQGLNATPAVVRLVGSLLCGVLAHSAGALLVPAVRRDWATVLDTARAARRERS